MTGVNGSHPIYRWVFGIFCRTTKLVVMYYVKNRKPHNLYPKIKRHIEPGRTIITDEHKSYISTISIRSWIAEFGYFHYFLNHSSGDYIHKKFPFVSNGGIETFWNRLKRNVPALKNSLRPCNINNYVDYYSTRHLI